MKVAVYHNLPTGGNKRSLYDTVRGMKASGHTVDVHTLDISEEHFKPLTEVADRVVTYPVRHVSRHPAAQLTLGLPPLWHVNRLVAEQINAGEYDVVWVSNCYLTQHPFILRYLRRPTILYSAEHFRQFYDNVWAHQADVAGHEFRSRIRHLSRRWFLSVVAGLDRMNIAHADNILVNSSFTRESLLRFYGKDSKVVHPAVDTECFRRLRLAKEHLVISVGGISSVKGHELVVRSLGCISIDQRPRLAVIADRVERERDRSRLEALAAKQGVDLQILLRVPDEALVAAYNRAKVTVCANVLEPFGLVPLESMACGTPVVAVREGGFRETIIDGETGFLVDRDEAGLSGAIEALLADDARQRALGTNGADLVEKRFSLGYYWAQVDRQLRAVATAGRLDHAWAPT